MKNIRFLFLFAALACTASAQVTINWLTGVPAASSDNDEYGEMTVALFQNGKIVSYQPAMHQTIVNYYSVWRQNGADWRWVQSTEVLAFLNTAPQPPSECETKLAVAMDENTQLKAHLRSLYEQIRVKLAQFGSSP